MKFGASMAPSGRLVRTAVIAAIACVAASLFASMSPGVAAQSRPALDIRSLSARRDAVSGGDVLLQIRLPAVPADKLVVTVNGRDVTSAFRPGREPNVVIGLVRGLSLDQNDVQASIKGERTTGQLTIVNHRITGPVTSGPHQTPFLCETEAFGLGPALEADCTVKTKVEYFYRSAAPPLARPTPAAGGAPASPAALSQVAPNPFKPFDPRAPRPPDLATTTTSEGRTVPYIVRREMGTINRAVYLIAFLHEPGQPLPDPWTTTPGWNGRLVYSFGGGCQAGYHQGRTVGGLLAAASQLEEAQVGYGDYLLAKGYAIAAASLNVFGTNCADLISAETTMMVKEHFIEQYGVPRYTIGAGGSGGSMQQQMIANNYPGLLDGIIPGRSYPDTMTFLVPLFDCELLDHAFETSSLPWTPEQKTAVAGHKDWSYCKLRGTAYPNLRATNCDPTAVPAALVYHPVTNRQGARCTYQDNLVNVYGRDPKTGFARRPFDNVGVQYGLQAFNNGQIGVDQFLDLNRRIGGHDIDGNVVAARTVADPEALRTAYQTGRINEGSGLSSVPIIDLRSYLDGTGDVHDAAPSAIMRARLKAANGSADNQVIIAVASTGTLGKDLATPDSPLRTVTRNMLEAMDAWLGALANDRAPARILLDRVVRNKPRELVDACYTDKLEKITDPARCAQLFPYWGNPRVAAGEPLTNDQLKCQLKPIDRKDYKRPLSDVQLASLKAVFPQGVCDYGRRSAGQVPSLTWLSYARPFVSAPVRTATETKGSGQGRPVPTTDKEALEGKLPEVDTTEEPVGMPEN